MLNCQPIAAGNQTKSPSSGFSINPMEEASIIYMFPPFCLINSCFEKINQEKVDALLITSVWQNKVWFPKIMESLIDDPILLPETQDIVRNSNGNSHPLAVQGHLPLSCLAHIRQAFSTRGLSEGVFGILNRSWRASTELAYSTAW